MRQKVFAILAICTGIMPVSLIMVWYRLTHTESFTVFEMLVYPLVIGGGNIILILALNRYLLKEKLRDFNPGQATLLWDIFAGFSLAAICFGLLFLERFTILRFLPQGKPPSQEVINLLTTLSQNPFLLVIWLGPVVWIGVAMFEEIVRVFFLNCLWKLGNNRSWEMTAIIIVSAFTGILHLYQGATGIISVGLQGLVMGLFYYKYRRIWPLIISHALYDSIQIVMFVVSVS
jgi:membrane protease YdiL (CAAX protease family)